jgi:hypothetical protein
LGVQHAVLSISGKQCAGGLVFLGQELAVDAQVSALFCPLDFRHQLARLIKPLSHGFGQWRAGREAVQGVVGVAAEDSHGELPAIKACTIERARLIRVRLLVEMLGFGFFRQMEK